MVWHGMPCCVMLRCVMSCDSMLCYGTLCYAMLCYVMLCYVMVCYVMACYAMCCYVVLYCVVLCYGMLWYVMLCYAMLSYAFGMMIEPFGNTCRMIHLCEMCVLLINSVECVLRGVIVIHSPMHFQTLFLTRFWKSEVVSVPSLTRFTGLVGCLEHHVR